MATTQRLAGSQRDRGTRAIDLSVQFGALALKNPILTASGTFGYAAEFEALTDVDALGGVVTKGISPRPRFGNPVPRMCETASGMINSIGLENVGLEGFRRDKAPYLGSLDTCAVVNFFGETFDEYVECAAGLDAIARDVGGVDALEMNISCPNIKKGGVEFGTDPHVARALVQACRQVTDLPMWVKLTPNITDIVALARAVVEGGADGLSIINTITAMGVDVRKRRPRIATVFGGLSGPAIKPIALRMVYQVARADLGVPICGIGGIATAEDVAEFLVAGATAVQVGTANFADPDCAVRIIGDLSALASELEVGRIADLIGTLRTDFEPICPK
ncbi:MAG: dihydroorotate dehydrogenase [Proteobacteria bacterium]|nr:dihydroorotate dehydrogenase [Pseudomonadota bacterium]